MNRNNGDKSNGFTLIEVIATLILSSLILLTVGFFIARGTKGYLLTKQNTEISDKARMALRRITLELQDATDISAINPTSMTHVDVEYKHADSTASRYIWHGTPNQILLAPQAGNNNILIENSTIAITPVDTSDAHYDTTAINVVLSVSHPDPAIGNVTFTTIVYPRCRQ